MPVFIDPSRSCKILPEQGKKVSLNLANNAGLVAHYPLKEGQGDIAYDLSGNNNHGRIVQAGWVDGRRGKCLGFYGGTYVNAGDPPSGILDFDQNPFSVSIWIRPRSALAQAPIAKLDGNPPSTRLDDYWAIVKNANGTISFRLNNFTGNVSFNATSATTVALNQWHHIVGVRVSATNAEIYVNGALAGSVGSISGVIMNTAGLLCIGGFLYKPTTLVSPFQGLIDDVRIYNIALSAIRIKQLYNSY